MAPNTRRQLAVVAALLLMATLAYSDTGQQASRRLLARGWFTDMLLPQQQQQKQEQGEQLSQGNSSSNTSRSPSCTGVLIGIGTQKGGTTAAWAYIKHDAHPSLRVSTEKEVGFWDQVHGWYKGCTLGDYMMLLNGTTDEPTEDPLPLCPAPGFRGPMYAQHNNRLRSSSICGIRRQLQEEAAAVAAAAAGLPPPPPPASPLRPCDSTYPKPWWWFWGGWHDSTAASPLRFGQDGQPINSSSSNSSSVQLVDAAEVSEHPVFRVDITPSYLYDATAPLWVRSMLPEARILVILREPAARAVSNFNMKWQKLREGELKRNETAMLNLTEQQREAAWVQALTANATQQMRRLNDCYALTGTEALRQPERAACMGVQQPYSPNYQSALWEDAMIWQGIYADGLERWFKLFPKEQFLIWISEDFKAEPAAHMRQLVSWLGLDMADINPKLLPGAKQLSPIHVREYEADAPEALLGSMRRFYEPHNVRLATLLKQKGFGSVADRMLQVWGQQQGTAAAAAAAAADDGLMASVVEAAAAAVGAAAAAAAAEPVSFVT
jgi:hypothetical protein